MKKILTGGAIVVILVVGAIVAFSGLYVVDETQQAVVTQFREVVNIVKEPGLKWKVPFIQKVSYYEKRLLEWDGDPNQIPTVGKKFIRVNTWARWHIVDLERFYNSVRDEMGGHAVLDDQIESALRNKISGLVLEEAVRSSSREMKYVTKEIEDAQETKQQIDVGRNELLKRVREKANSGLRKEYGMELVNVQIKRINYVEKVRRDVYARMRSERKRIAEKYLSEARQKKQQILGRMNRTLEELESEGYREAETIKGEANAEAARIYAEAYGRSPEFYGFMKSLETYRKTIDDRTTLILGTDSPYFRYLKGVETDRKTSDQSPEGLNEGGVTEGQPNEKEEK
ncbi:MAG: protease modulator HflC [Planctomycetes bacterium]|nr:protease modulator HflC [Planctomycetota bacterium]